LYDTSFDNFINSQTQSEMTFQNSHLQQQQSCWMTSEEDAAVQQTQKNTRLRTRQQYSTEQYVKVYTTVTQSVRSFLQYSSVGFKDRHKSETTTLCGIPRNNSYVTTVTAKANESGNYNYFWPFVVFTGHEYKKKANLHKMC